MLDPKTIKMLRLAKVLETNTCFFFPKLFSQSSNIQTVHYWQLKQQPQAGLRSCSGTAERGLSMEKVEVVTGADPSI